MRENINLGMAAPNVHGRARVQLFDPTGRCVRDEVQDNFVSERWLRAMAWYANWGAFSNNTKTTAHNTTMQSAPAFREIPFTGIALTDYDGAPDQDERLVRGVPLAHASKGVAGGGTSRGTYNAAESVHEFAYHKLVFDFATSQANGIFQSIYTGPISAGDINISYAQNQGGFYLNSDSYFAEAWRVRDDATGTLYQCEATAIYEVTDWTPMAYGSAPVMEKKADLAPAAEPYAFTIRDGRMYWLTASVSNARSIISAPLSDLTYTRIEKTLNSAWGTAHGGGSNAGQHVTGFTYHPARDEFFISIGSNGANRPLFALMSLDPATFADGDKWGAEGDQVYSRLAAYPGETGIITNRAATTLPRTRHIQLEDDGSITVSFASDCQIMPYGGSDISSSSSSSGSGSTSTNQWYQAPAQHFFSRALLDAPVEKTSQNTMKITYEFTLDDPALP